jgi:hypothetical protein
MQRAAVSGIFTTLWHSMVYSQYFDGMVSVAQARADGNVDYTLEGRAAVWRTFVHLDRSASWTVNFADGRFGGWSIGLDPFGGVRYQYWHPNGSGAPEFFTGNEIYLDAETFVGTFERLRRATASYIKHYELWTNRDMQPLIRDILKR